MAGALAGRRIAFLVANEGVEQVELTDPWQAVEQDDGRPVLLAPSSGEVQSFNGRTAVPGSPYSRPSRRSRPDEFAGLVLPGGVVNADQLRTKPGAVALVREFVDAGKPVAAICHAGWTLIEAGAVQGKTHDLVAEPAHRPGERRGDLGGRGGARGPSAGWSLITSRNPDDLPEFCREANRAFAG